VVREPEPEGVEQLQGSLLDLADRYYNARDYAAALPCYERALGQRRGQAVHYSRASLAAFRTGDTARALGILRRAMEVLPAAEMRGSMWYNMGCFAARLGRFCEALRYLNRAVDAGYDDPEQFRRDPDLAPLRWHAGFKALLAGLS
jgi:tetratricopeptide (TPR) repeat protein